MGKGQGPRGQLQSVPKAGRTSFPCDKGSLVENRRGLWNHIQPQRGLQAFQGPRRPENLAGAQLPCLKGGGTKLNRKLWRWVNMGLSHKYGGASRIMYLTLTTVGRARNQPSCF